MERYKINIYNIKPLKQNPTENPEIFYSYKNKKKESTKKSDNKKLNEENSENFELQPFDS